MLFPEEDSHHLKTWIVKRLENTSDADADVLADYVLALLRHDGDINDVRKLCEEEIPDFLKEDSSIFVRDVFDAIAYRSYLPGAPPPPKHAPGSAPAVAAQSPTNLYYDDSLMASGPTFQPPFQSGSRKRAYNDWDDPNAQNGRDGAFGGRSFKHPRRGAFGGRGPQPDDVGNFRGVPPAMPLYPPSSSQMPSQGAAPTPATVGYFDPSKGPMEAMFGMSMAAGHPMPELMSQDRGQYPLKRRKKCRDWERKGYCQRGANCMFQHGDDPVYPALPGLPFGGMQPVPQPSAVEEYDPADALMPDMFTGPGPFQGQPSLPDFGHHPRPRGGRHQNRQKRGDKAPFSADGPVYDKTKSTIVVESIPEENFSEDQVKEFFSQYGNILEVSMQPYKRLAIVKFDSWNSANAAYQSPKVIFDNRFVKVFWYKDDESAIPPSAPMTGGVPGAKKTHRANGAADTHAAGHQPEIDLEEFARQQEKKQKAFEEKTKKREEIERQREELEKRQKELIAKQLEESARLQAKLAARNGVKSEDHDGDSKSKSKSMTQSEALRAQLAALEAEARQMGLDPDAMSDAPAPWSARGGSYAYGRGRGGWRGPSSSPYTPRGSYRGGYRGRANVHAAYAAYSLDNRPKKVVLTGVDFTVSEKDETLRQYLFGIGEFTDIQTTPTSTEITFKDRKTAEKFFNSVLLNNKEIPGLEASPVELAWGGANGSTGSVPTTPGASSTNNPSTPAATSVTGAPTSAATLGVGNGVKPKQETTAETAAGASAVSSDDKDVHIMLERPPAHQHHGHHQHHQDQNEMDYEVADENQWGY
ncbi:hypothetical protein VTI74DRAFT_4931 [Chaetomium olivicolor]